MSDDPAAAPQGPPGTDFVQGFTVPGKHVRGRLVRLGPVLDAVIGAHQYPPPIEALLAEALTLTALLGAMLKGAGDDEEAGQLTLQAQTEAGVVSLLVCDYRDGDVRGYVQFDAERLAEAGANPSLFALFGKGYLAITFDQAVSGERYQGIVPLDGASLAEAAEHYFDQSEQIPSMVRIATRRGTSQGTPPDAAAQGCAAGGLLLQYLPEGEVGRARLHVRRDWPEWDEIEILGRSVTDAELIDHALDADALLWRLFSETGEVRRHAARPLAKGCRCNVAHIADVLSRFPESERADMRDDSGMISVDCAFCSRVFQVAG